MTKGHPHRQIPPLALAAVLLLVLGFAGASGALAEDGAYEGSDAAASCSEAKNIEGTYSCKGECLITQPDGSWAIAEIPYETDKITLVPKSQFGIYRVDITGPPDPHTGWPFREIEIGSLHGFTLRSATARVIDNEYPVLEESTFQVDAACNATGFVKQVRNPTKDNYKICIVPCTRTGPP